MHNSSLFPTSIHNFNLICSCGYTGKQNPYLNVGHRILPRQLQSKSLPISHKFHTYSTANSNFHFLPRVFTFLPVYCSFFIAGFTKLDSTDSSLFPHNWVFRVSLDRTAAIAEVNRLLNLLTRYTVVLFPWFADFHRKVINHVLAEEQWIT